MSLVEPEGTDRKPPPPQEIKRKLRFYRAQAIGVPLLAILPVLALFGVFDTSCVTTTKQGPGVELQVTYASKFRFKTSDPMEIRVRNTGSTELKDVDVAISREYVEKFVDVQFEPDITKIDGDYIVTIEKIPPGEDRKVTMDMRADQAGSARGKVHVRTTAGQIEADISTFVYP